MKWGVWERAYDEFGNMGRKGMVSKETLRGTLAYEPYTIVEVVCKA